MNATGLIVHQAFSFKNIPHPSPAFLTSPSLSIRTARRKRRSQKACKMADRSSIGFQAGQAAGHAQAIRSSLSFPLLYCLMKCVFQVKKDELVDKARDAAQQGTERAGGFLQQTGDQVKQMAQGAADAVKNAVGMGSGGGPTTTTTHTTTTRR
ncbi:Late embryogenesis abundant protein 76 [Apostasia shenzhenica]|uniref:Late embryogenesis abundant protein 76 n=1 Tax=Apostasia shenzhenica TaxID=1088818 RepID=A0A2I0AG00_9ASPA|nr:Late embryogenesis abundant protein 76 [Apostasia shenzhenica]